jgi:membrane associated rhomboid family serine protease
MGYYRQRSFSFGPGAILPPVVKYLLIANGIAFLLELVIGGAMIYYLGLVPRLITGQFMVWQFFTYMFLHGGFFHLLFNMFALWMFGSDIERVWGSREFLNYYLICGLGAGAFNFVLAINSPIPVIGASGAIYGILVAFAMLFPNRLIYIYFLFPIKAKYLVIIFGAIEFFASLGQSQGGVAHFAHLGGMVVGFLYLKSDWRLSSLWKKASDVRYRRKVQKIVKKREQGQELMDQVDAILDKINRVGYENLTEEEKETLDKASKEISEDR